MTTVTFRPGFCYACGQHPDDMGPRFRAAVHDGAGRHRSPRPRTLRETLLDEHGGTLDAIAEAVGITGRGLGAGWELLSDIESDGFLAGMRAARGLR